MKLKLPIQFFLVMAFCLTLNKALAQYPSSDAQYFVPSSFPKSPNVASFTKYGDYQVNLYTGLPDISIPLYTIEAGGLKVPITLSYHASGIKLTDVASWVGMGWSIPGGGAVTRRTMGGADDGVYGYLSTYVRTTSLSMAIDSEMLYVNNVASGLYDAQPDIYSYDFPGHSGKFFLNGKNKFKAEMIPFAPIDVKYTYAAPPTTTVKALSNFTLTDDNGNVCRFGDNSIEQTETEGAGNNAGALVTTSWMMENMVSQNRRDTISFTYGSDNLEYPDATSQMQVLTDGVGYLGGYNSGNVYTPSNLPGPTTSMSTTVNELPMQQINFKNGKVVFDLDDTVRRDINQGGRGNNVKGLKDIKVYIYNYATKVMEVQKTIKFYKSYFGTAANNNARLRLDSIQVLDAAGAIIQHYRFGYNNNIILPYYGSFARDYWGYYNGKTTSTSLIPYMTVPYNGGTTTIGGTSSTGATITNNRDCDSNYMQAEVLDTIYYPTGGHTVFTYQSNQYLNSANAVRVAGGLRVQSIASYDGISAIPIIKSYQYNEADSNFFLAYHYFAAPTQRHVYYAQFQSFGLAAANTCSVHNYVSNPNIDLEPFDAATVVYPFVTEYYGTPGNNVGKSTYLYSTETDDTNDASFAGTPIVNSYFYMRGELLSKTDFLRKSDGTYQAVKSVNNIYFAFPQRIYADVGFVARRLNTNEGLIPTPIYVEEAAITPSDVNSFLWGTYPIISDDNYLTSTTTNIYDTSNPTNYTSSTVNYTYGDTTHQQIAKTTHTDSKGNLHITTNKYAFDYLSGTTTHNAVLDTMLNRHMYAEAIEKWDSLKNVASSVNAVTDAQLNRFQYGNITGTIVPSTINTLSVSSPITDFTQASVVSGNLTGDSRYVQMIGFNTYDANNNITTYTPRNANPTGIIWDYQNDLPIAQVKNVSSSFSGGAIAAYTSFEADGKGYWLYSGTPVTDPTAPTGSKVYPLSSGAVSISFYNNAKANIVSYWSNNGAATVTCSTVIAGTPLVTTNGWTYYEHTIPQGSVSAITISGTTSIDELRLYPVDAQMTTYAYAPAGVTSIADTKGSISHFEYDPFQRLKNLKDWQGNIIKNYGYHTYDQTVPNDAQSGTFTRNNCPAGTSPTSAPWSVSAAKYLSSTKASANAEALYDLNTNGQINANQVCGCPVTTISFTLSNSTGINGFQATFSGVSTPFNFPTTGSTTVQVPAGLYATVTIGAVGSGTHTFTLGSSQQQTNVHSASFSNVSVATGSSTLSLSIQ